MNAVWLMMTSAMATLLLHAALSIIGRVCLLIEHHIKLGSDRLLGFGGLLA